MPSVCFEAIALFVFVMVIYAITEAMQFRRVGGLTFWRIGRLGGSFYWQRRQ